MVDAAGADGSPGRSPQDVLILKSPGAGHDAVAALLEPADADASFPGRLNATGPLVPLDRVASLAPEVAQALSAGKVMRVVGGPAGELMKSGNDTLAIARHADGTIAGPLRFDGGPKNVRAVAAPTAVFQVAGAVTLQYYLDTISKQLEALQRGVSDIKSMLSQDRRGALFAAERFVATHERLMEDGLPLGTNQAPVEQHLGQVRQVYFAAQDSVRTFINRAHSLVADDGTITDHDRFDEALAEMTREGVEHVATFLAAAALTVRLLRLQQVVAVEAGLGQVQALREQAVAEVGAMRDAVAELPSFLERWIVSDAAIEAHEAGFAIHHKFSSTGRKLAVRDYTISTFELRRGLARAADELFASLDPRDASYVLDCQLGAEGLQTRVAAIEPARAA